jgi:magnesium-transporting ATPase (P-type)
MAHFRTGASGLSLSDAQDRLNRDGPNSLPAPAGKSFLLRLALQFHNVLIYVLLASAAITLTLGHLADGLVILAVVLANAFIGVIQEGRAETAMASIRQILAPRATVLREGRRTSIDGKDVVAGDIILLEAGERVPADLRLFETNGLFIQEALLTGESVPVEKMPDQVSGELPIAERSSMAFSGTMVTRGQGMGVTVATGGQSEIGRISGLLEKVEELQTPLILQMNIFARWLTFLILLVAALLFAYGLGVQQQDPQFLFMSIVGLSVAAIPEGLPAVLTITLAIGVQAMARRNAIIRRLPAIETLGSVSVICTDKTGTLTYNEMTVSHLALAQCSYTFTGEGYDPTGGICRAGETAPAAAETVDPLLRKIARSAFLCNDSTLVLKNDDWTVEGDPMEGALLAMSRKITSGDQPLTDWQRLAVLPFDARHRYMATLSRPPQAGEAALIAVKGAPERLLAMCSHELDGNGAVKPLDEQAWHTRADALAKEGQRVLALAEKPVTGTKTELIPTDLEDGLVLLGLVGLMDPPRPEAVEAVADCLSAGIRVKMITGDHAGTASSIGRIIGLVQPDAILTGADIDLMTDADLRTAVLDTDIFARTSPEHKLRLVEALQAHDLTVAMTGDGVNDAPALKRADAGIAMGRKGSEAAREAADVVLADDNFRSIADAVREGRTVYDNIVKVIGWTLPTSTGEALTVVAALLLGLTMPVTAVQILWINLITASTLGIALAYEPSEGATMERPPRERSRPILTIELAWHIVLVSVLFMAAVFSMFVYMTSQGHSVEYARTVAVNTLVVLEIFQLLFVRTMRSSSLSWREISGTRPVWLAIGIVVAGQAAITYLPALQQIFGTEALNGQDIALIFALGIVLYAILESEKRMRMALRGGSHTSMPQEG